MTDSTEPDRSCPDAAAADATAQTVFAGQKRMQRILKQQISCNGSTGISSTVKRREEQIIAAFQRMASLDIHTYATDKQCQRQTDADILLFNYNPPFPSLLQPYTQIEYTILRAMSHSPEIDKYSTLLANQLYKRPQGEKMLEAVAGRIADLKSGAKHSDLIPLTALPRLPARIMDLSSPRMVTPYAAAVVFATICSSYLCITGNQRLVEQLQYYDKNQSPDILDVNDEIQNMHDKEGGHSPGTGTTLSWDEEVIYYKALGDLLLLKTAKLAAFKDLENDPGVQREKIFGKLILHAAFQNYGRIGQQKNSAEFIAALLDARPEAVDTKLQVNGKIIPFREVLAEGYKALVIGKAGSVQEYPRGTVLCWAPDKLEIVDRAIAKARARLAEKHGNGVKVADSYTTRYSGDDTSHRR